jgi:hypothetical protein
LHSATVTERKRAPRATTPSYRLTLVAEP